MQWSLSKLRETVKDRDVWHAAVHGVTKSQTQLSNWTAYVSRFLGWECKGRGVVVGERGRGVMVGSITQGMEGSKGPDL